MTPTPPEIHRHMVQALDAAELAAQEAAARITEDWGAGDDEEDG